MGLLTPFAHSSDITHNSCLFFATPEDDNGLMKDPRTGARRKGTLPVRAGRIVVDTGFTKLWMEYGKEKGKGTDRYIRNATVWLLGLDYRVDHGLDLKSVLQAAPPPVVLLQLKEPYLDRGSLLDIIFVVDGSGSVTASGFEHARESIRAVAEQADFQLCQMGVLQFSTRCSNP